MQRSILLGNIEAETGLAQMARPAGMREPVKFEGAEFGLRVGKNVFHRRKLQQVLRIPRAEHQALAPVHDGTAQTQSYGSDAVSKSHRRHGIEVVRTHDPGKIRIKTLAVQGAHDLLQNHRHFFFFQPVGSRAHVGLGVLAEGGGVYALDCL